MDGSDGALPPLLSRLFRGDVLEFLMEEKKKKKGERERRGRKKGGGKKKMLASNVSLENWNKFYHDHAVEIATGPFHVLTGGRENGRGGRER